MSLLLVHKNASMKQLEALAGLLTQSRPKVQAIRGLRLWREKSRFRLLSGRSIELSMYYKTRLIFPR